MLSRCLFISLVCFSTMGYGQRVVDVDKDNVNALTLFYSVAGQPFNMVKYVKVIEGSPYFNEHWMRGSLTLKDTVEYVNMRLRLDLISNDIEYIDKKTGQTMIATSHVREIRLVDSLTGRSFHFIHSTAIAGKDLRPGWYQLLVAGKTSLYKRIHKEIDERRPYNSATTEQRITSIDHYFIQLNGSFTRVKKIKDIPDLFPANKAALSDYINNKKLTGKTDSDYISLVNECNQLYP